MKETNLLVFRDMSVKIGDLGISVKFQKDDIAGTQPLYTIKGFTRGYITKEIDNAFQERDFVTKQ